MVDFLEQPEMELLRKARRARAQALAIIRRGRDAKIPERFLRIDEESFRNLLCEKYHKDLQKLSSFIYNDANHLLEKSFIAIDGGNTDIRKRAGFALLFRLIACDKFGLYMECSSLVHKLQSIKSTSEISRNDLVEELKSYDILFISEFSRSIFKPHWESGEFFDEILSHRENYSKPTIISFSEPMKTLGDLEKEAAKEGFNKDCGIYLAGLLYKEKQTDSVFRVRVKAI